MNDGAHKRVKGIQAETEILEANNELHFRCTQFDVFMGHYEEISHRKLENQSKF